MSNSNLVTYTKISPNKNPKNGRQNKKITIHHMAGNLTVETCGNVFQTRQASSNYGVDSQGNVGLYVPEDYRSWASSSPDNDYQAVTIEVANDGGAPNWHVSDKALEKTIDLCVDICQRNGINELNYTGDNTGNLTKHNDFTQTTCPGPYLQSKFEYIAKEVNMRMIAKDEQPKSDPINAEGLQYRAHVENLGDLAIVRDGMISGTVGSSLRLEGLYIDTRGLSYDVKINVKCHEQNVGWTLYEDVKHDTLIGSSGMSHRLECLMFEVEGLPEGKDLYCSGHCQNIGWIENVPSGYPVGTVQQALRLEALKLWIGDK